MSIDYQLLGKHIRSKRKEFKHTQENLAEALAVSVGYVSQIERGVTKVSLDTLSNIATFLSCEIAELITGTSRSQPQYLFQEFLTTYSRMNEQQKHLLLNIACCIRDADGFRQ